MLRAEQEFEAELEALMEVLERSDLEAEIAEFEGEAEIDYVRAARDLWVITQQGGQRDENKLADAIFYDRHPEWKGKQLKNAALPLRQEWTAIRDYVVRPYLQNYPAQPPVLQPAPPPPAPAPAAPPPAMPEQFGFSNFENILKYQPYQYPMAIAAQNEYRGVSAFQPYYNKISTLASATQLPGLTEHGDQLLFHVDGRVLAEVLESSELRGKVVETMAHGVLGFIFNEELITALGLGLTLLELAQSIENERMVSGVGPEYDQWRHTKIMQFAFALIAEDISRRNFGAIIFNSNDPRDIAVDLAQWYAKFQPIYNRYSEFFNLEHRLGVYQGNPPASDPPTMRPG